MLNLFLSFVNVLFGVAAGASEGAAGVQSSRSSLIVKPSASGRGTHRFDPNMARPSVPVGAGGQGAKEGKGDESLADKIGKMADETQQQEQQQGQENAPENNEQAEDHEEDGEDDEDEDEEYEPQEQRGTVLREPREDETPNPKKRMWEEPLEGEEGHDEL